MANEDSYLLLIREFGRLYNEYKNCECDKTKQELIKRIKAVGEALSDT
jgi:hypothetical protein